MLGVLGSVLGIVSELKYFLLQPPVSSTPAASSKRQPTPAPKGEPIPSHQNIPIPEVIPVPLVPTMGLGEH